ncbi:MAG: methyltransferase domain-containing protein [Deltaproteobacteria bacterium]|nr:methyltransferase domain-containing protein [Deltaproteobacteria bacterium]
MAGELHELPAIRVGEIRHRLVSGEGDAPLASLVGLRSADDAFVEVARFDGMERARSSLALLEDRMATVDLRPALDLLRELRPLPARPSLSISASFVGRRNYATADLKGALAQGLARAKGPPVALDERDAPLHLRLVLEHGHARIGLRLARVALHERGWKRAHRPGSLRPSVAAALWRLAGLTPGERALDACCGAGTLLGEAAAVGARAIGGDRDPTALVVAAENLRGLGAAALLARWDACALPLPPACVDVAASNLPWGRQVASDSPPERFHAAAAAELARVLVPGGRAVLLADADDPLAPGPLRVEAAREIGLSGRRPKVLVLSRPRAAA